MRIIVNSVREEVQRKTKVPLCRVYTELDVTDDPRYNR